MSKHAGEFLFTPPAERPERRVSCRAPELLETATCSRTLQQGGYILKRSLGVETVFVGHDNSLPPAPVSCFVPSVHFPLLRRDSVSPHE